jgi:hypothetical protein
MTQRQGENTANHELQHQRHPHLPGMPETLYGKDDEDEPLRRRLRQMHLQEEETVGGSADRADRLRRIKVACPLHGGRVLVARHQGREHTRAGQLQAADAIRSPSGPSSPSRRCVPTIPNCRRWPRRRTTGSPAHTGSVSSCTVGEGIGAIRPTSRPSSWRFWRKLTPIPTADRS